jgi:hypothetical protein
MRGAPGGGDAAPLEAEGGSVGAIADGREFVIIRVFACEAGRRCGGEGLAQWWEESYWKKR